MDFIDNVDFVPSRYWAVANTFNNFSRIINAGMACRINL